LDLRGGGVKRSTAGADRVRVALPFTVVRGGLALAGALLVALLMVPVAGASAGCRNANTQPTGSNTPALRASVLCLVNKERTAQGLRALKSERRLVRAAKRHSADMVARHYFDHLSPEGESMKDRAVAARYLPERGTWKLAENIAWGSGTRSTPAQIVKNWMSSAPHRANILDRGLRQAGVGLSEHAPFGGDGVTFTLLFGTR
jgi:uncharacterized protein YkwD